MIARHLACSCQKAATKLSIVVTYFTDKLYPIPYSYKLTQSPRELSLRIEFGNIIPMRDITVFNCATGEIMGGLNSPFYMCFYGGSMCDETR
jgi:hypothetical protein